MLLITNYIPFPREGFERVVGRFILFHLLSNKILPPSVWGASVVWGFCRTTE